MRKFFVSILVFFLASCSLFEKKEEERKPEPVASHDRPAAASVDVGVDWSWRVLGDAAVRPIQVFSLKEKTYLHMREQKPVVLLVGGEAVPYRVSPPYLVVNGVPRQIDIVSDGYRAIAVYAGRAVGEDRSAVKSSERVQRVEMK